MSWTGAPAGGCPAEPCSLEEKGYVDWDVEGATPGRGGHPRRRFKVTRSGVAALRTSRDALFRFWHGLEGVLGEPKP
jgi:hypothetical protein